MAQAVPPAFEPRPEKPFYDPFTRIEEREYPRLNGLIQQLMRMVSCVQMHRCDGMGATSRPHPHQRGHV